MNFENAKENKTSGQDGETEDTINEKEKESQEICLLSSKKIDSETDKNECSFLTKNKIILLEKESKSTPGTKKVVTQDDDDKIEPQRKQSLTTDEFVRIAVESDFQNTRSELETEAQTINEYSIRNQNSDCHIKNIGIENQNKNQENCILNESNKEDSNDLKISNTQNQDNMQQFQEFSEICSENQNILLEKEMANAKIFQQSIPECEQKKTEQSLLEEYNPENDVNEKGLSTICSANLTDASLNSTELMEINEAIELDQVIQPERSEINENSSKKTLDMNNSQIIDIAQQEKDNLSIEKCADQNINDNFEKNNQDLKENDKEEINNAEMDESESLNNESKDFSEKLNKEGLSKLSKQKIDDLNDGCASDDLVNKSISIKSTDLKEPDSEPSEDILPGQDDELCIIPDSDKQKRLEHNNEEIYQTKENKNLNTDESEKNPELETSLSNSKKNNCIVTNEVEITKSTSIKVAELSLVNNCDFISENIMLSKTQPIKELNILNNEHDSKNSDVEEISNKRSCKYCQEEKICPIPVKRGINTYEVCSDVCKKAFLNENNKVMDIPSEGVSSKRDKRCANCLLIVEPKDERNLSWETMEFCNEECLGKFQTKYGSYCRNCNGHVQPVSLGKYCVRFGYDVRQFCCSSCLEEFKKGLKVCSYCQKDISVGIEGFLAPVGDKGQFKDFCTQDCMEKYSKMNTADPPVQEKKICGVCQQEKLIHCEVQIDRTEPVPICSEPCFAAFKFVNKVDPEQCTTCKRYFELPARKGFVVFYEDEAHIFCNKTCLNIFIITNRKIVPCNWCKVKKYNFDMIRKDMKNSQVIMMCSLNCLTLYQVSINAVSARRINCDFCKEFSQAQYHLTMSDATIRNFCSYKCVMNFQAQYTRSPITIPTSDDPVPTGAPKRTIPISRPNQASTSETVLQTKKTLPVISSVTSLAPIGNGQASNVLGNSPNNITTVVPQYPVQQKIQSATTGVQIQQNSPQIIYRQQIITRPSSPISINNKIVQCKPVMHTKGVSVRPIPCSKETQTENMNQVILPIPVPIYVPYPVHMYSLPCPIPVPIPLPIPVPIFIPTTRNSAKGIFKEIKKIQEKFPSDPFEAELLMMAEMAEIGTDKKVAETDSDSGDENRPDKEVNNTTNAYSPEVPDSSNTFGEDMLQMALKMATGEIDEPAVDLEAALTPNTIPNSHSQSDLPIENVPPSRTHSFRGRKRNSANKIRCLPSKRGRRTLTSNESPLSQPEGRQSDPPRFLEPVEKPDANMTLKYTFGVNAWRQWVVLKNAELEKQSVLARKTKLFKTDLLQLTADELNYSLCLFAKEVKKPNGADYAPDTIYYLCLGIQQYLFQNNRIDNIFTDTYYEKFTDCLNEVAKKFSVIHNDAQYIVTRVEEEHLWECKQLGAHSPHVLLTTLMFFNTKHFNLVTHEEHMQVSFSHIMKHWKRASGGNSVALSAKPSTSRNILLRFYPPQSTLDTNSRKKKVYEQQENEDNPLRCPVKLYEFYLSKCPESVKSRNDVFYLLPERSCVPDSPVWYSTTPLAKEQLMKMLNRIKMVKEINIALLSS